MYAEEDVADDSGAFWQGITGVDEGVDGDTIYVKGAHEEDYQAKVEDDRGSVAVQGFSWDPTLTEIVVPPPPPPPEPSSCSEERDCGCCDEQQCPDLTYYDEAVAMQAAEFMALMAAEGAAL